MSISIPCAVFQRLSHCAFRPTDVTGNIAPRPALACVRIEIENRTKLAIAANGHIMAIENLGDTDEPDAMFNIGITPTLLERCGQEAPYNGVITVANLVAKTTFGFTEMSISSQDYVDWRKAVPTFLPKKSLGGVMFDGEQINRLVKSSPSGFIVLQQHFDKSRPVIARDIADPNWLGVFMVQDPETDTPAELPKWISHASA